MKYMDAPAGQGHACCCRHPPFRFVDYDSVELGEDSRGAEVSLATCKSCGAIWLKYFIDEPHYPRSGRWWRVEIAAADASAMSAAAARECVERSREGFAGGSFFDSHGHAITAPIKVR
ncbi:hypothetical protein NX786_21275 [Telluria mixta]|uniref:CENP-V/GFA domain-containing protein n=1 Tax=Telluria mixta TaxID=34071 RepID=A0ABT2C3G1_9BURK|nr:hypothetical protein [Telluria mixta]MCS0631866.1 hypothetical protein [Telluria mixta]WEM95448.1 hypothetical protein P0M04_28900 [Telluria mixta]